MEQKLIKLDYIQDNPYQPRTVDDPEHIKKLAMSIATDGLLQLPQARNHQENGMIQLAFGHSRRKAFEWLRDIFPTSEGLPDRYDSYTCMPVEIVDLTDEQMYRFAVTENVQRKDLAPTELARSMQRYMEEFQANSKQVGELFGMSDATVRGMVRLLDLPAEAQQSLDEGKITQGTARTLLSMQKIVSPAALTKTLEHLHKGADRWDDAQTPEEIIQDELRDLANVEDLWTDKQEGKPRAGYNKWLLSMKNFPNKFLPELTPVDLALALGIEDDQHAIAVANTYRMIKLGQLEDRDVTTLGISDEHAAKIDNLINPPACNICPFYAKIDGVHYCGMKTCWKRKCKAWDREKVRATSSDLGIKVYDSRADGAYQVLGSYRDDGNKKLFDGRHQDLRIALTEDIKGAGHYQWGYNGVPDVARVLVVGQTMKDLKTTRQAETIRQTAVLSDDGEQSRKHQRRVEELAEQKENLLFWEAALYVKTLFDAFGKNALMYMDDMLIYQELECDEVDEPDSTDAQWPDFKRRMYAFGLLTEAACNQSTGHTLVDVAAWLSKTAKDWGVTLPKSIEKMAIRLDAEIQAVAAETPKAKK